MELVATGMSFRVEGMELGRLGRTLEIDPVLDPVLDIAEVVAILRSLSVASL